MFDTPVCSSGMRTLNRKLPFRLRDNSPFPQHLTLRILLCFNIFYHTSNVDLLQGVPERICC